MPKCPTKLLTGLDCPFCGMSRSFASCLHGRVVEGFAHHPAGPLLLAATAVTLAAIGWRALRRRAPLWGGRRLSQGLAFAAGLCIVAGLLRSVVRRVGAA